MRILLLLLISFQLFAFDLVNMSFIDYVRFVSNTTKKNFIVDDNINKKINLIVPYGFNPDDSYTILKSFVKTHDMYIQKIGTTYFIHKYSKDKQYHTYKLIFLLPDKILPFLKKSYPDVKFFKSKKTIIYSSLYKDSIQIKKFISLLDKPIKSKIIKITLISYKDSDLKKIGLNLSATDTAVNGNIIQYKSFLDTLVSSSSLIFSSSSVNLSLFMDNLKSKEAINVKFAPTLTLFDNKITKFTIAQKIPYLNGQSHINGSNDIQNNSYSYNDVGTKIDINKVSITDKALYFHISLDYQTILDKSITPTTSERSIDNYLKLDDGQSLVISGIKSSNISHVHKEIPILSSIPYLGKLFQWDSKTHENTTSAIIITSISRDKVSEFQPEKRLRPEGGEKIQGRTK